MFNLSELATEHLANKEQAGILVHRIAKMQRGKELLGDIPETELAEDEKKILSIVQGWKKRLFELELSICRYELVVGTLDTRERMVLHLHFEKGLSMRQISKMNLQKYSVEKISTSTLNRVRRALVNKFNEQYLTENPLFISDLANAKNKR